MTKNARENGANLNGEFVSSTDGSEMISEKLKQLYDSVCDEGISDRFLDLLEKLDAAEKNSSDDGQSS